MIDCVKKISLFNRDKAKIKKKVLIIGRGRWSKIILSELDSNFPNLKNIFVFSPSFKTNEKKLNRKIVYINSLQLISKEKITYVIIANKNSGHLRYIKLFLKKECHILCEKPLTITKKKLINLTSKINKKKNSVSISMQYFYAFYLNFINRNFIKNKIIERITIDWFDIKNEKRGGFIKKHDLKLNFIEDIFYHFYSILYLLIGIKEYTFQNKPIKIKKIVQLKFNSNKKTKIILNSSRSEVRRRRIVRIYFNNKDRIFLDFSKDTSLNVKFNEKKLKIPFQFMNKTLKYQLFFFLKQKINVKNKELNSLKNLEIFFKNMYILKKKL